jgi:3-hydroxybutyrate dehydrogenase
METARRATGPDLAGRRALVTGSASGIGAGTAARLADLGASVVVADIDREAAEAIADRIGGEAWVVDLSDPARLAGLELDVDILVNNAGVQHVSPVHEFPPERFAFILRLMLEAPFLLTRAALPHMYARGWGRVVHVSSAHGLRASPFKSAYVAAKHGLEGLSKVIALEGAPHGVTSNCVNPAYVRTPLVENQIADQARAHGLPEQRVLEDVILAPSAVKRLLEPEEVAEVVAFLAGPGGGGFTGRSSSRYGSINRTESKSLHARRTVSGDSARVITSVSFATAYSRC